MHRSSTLHMDNPMRISAALCAVFIQALVTYGQHVDLALAERYATEHYQRHRSPVNGDVEASPTNSVIGARDGEVFYYAFNFGREDGFVIIAADERVYPIIGYAYEGTFTASDRPYFIEHLLSRKMEEIASLRQRGGPAAASVAEAWRALAVPGSMKSDRSAIAPLMQTTWDQDCYYNMSCRPDNAGPCGHMLTGCVATAMGQIMKYWEYPVQGTGSYSYQYMGATDSADFGSTTYDWGAMADVLTGPNLAVSTLLYHCGVAATMHYGPTNSWSSDMIGGMKLYFDYADEAENLNWFQYPNYEEVFADTMVAELMAGRPVYVGNSDHGFVCDGYQDTGYFHMNWGWGGSFDGYWRLSDAAIDHIAIHIHPNGQVGIEGSGEAAQRSVSAPYPNPCSRSIRFDLGVDARSEGNEVMMVDPHGGIVIRQLLRDGQRSVEMDVSALAAGMYFLRVRMMSGEQVVQRVVVE